MFQDKLAQTRNLEQDRKNPEHPGSHETNAKVDKASAAWRSAEKNGQHPRALHRPGDLVTGGKCHPPTG